jgi:enoyl-CoA hydratase/carnithine racemase
MRYADYQELRVRREGDVLTVGLRKPGNGRKHTELSRLFAEVRADDVRVVVLTGEGDAFMPHADMRWYASVGEQDWLQLMREGKWLDPRHGRAAPTNRGRPERGCSWARGVDR